MFNLNKDTIQHNTDKLAKDTHEVVDQMTDSIKKTASTVTDTIHEKTESVKDQAQRLVDQLKSMVHDATDVESTNDFKSELTQKINALQATISDEASHAYFTSKQRTVDVVKENPIGTIVVAAGVGLLLGYVLGSKQSTK